jgi:phosphoglycolate phosphatase-like HAD superfamily hydrolase
VTQRILLFDVDGTLVRGAAGYRAFETALLTELGPVDPSRSSHMNGMRLDGMTDRLIVRHILEAMGRAFDEALCDRILASYVGELGRQERDPRFEVLPGVVELLEALRARGAPVGLCTGNVAEGARIKLSWGGIAHHFTYQGAGIHGFASDGEARERIVLAALARASAMLGRTVTPGEALVIGDTPRDVDAAHRAGCPVLAVATGRFSMEELRQCGADRVLSDLGGPDVLELLG